MSEGSPLTLPLGLQKIAEVIGPKLACKLADHFGGQEACYVPKRPTVTHQWAQCIGFEALSKLGDVFGGSRLDIPRGVYRNMAKVRIYDALDANPDASRRQLARELHVTERYIRKVANADKSDPDQGNLL